MLAELGLVPPVPTVQGEAERLDELRLGAPFDVVHMRLALDHCHDPVRAVRQMLDAARPNGVVLIEHYRDPESHDRFQGMRRWALDPEPGDLVIRSASGAGCRLSEELTGADIGTWFDETWLATTISRLADPPSVH
jgi:SAM-dependent methyltransferase